MLKERYDAIENMKNWEEIEKYLDLIPDLTKMHRQITIGKLNPCLVATLKVAYENVKKLNPEMKIRSIEYINERINLIEIIKYNRISEIQTNIFKENYNEELTNISIEINKNKEYIKNVEELLDDILKNEIKKGSNFITYDEEYQCFMLTQKRYEIFKKSIVGKVLNIAGKRIVLCDEIKVIFESKSASKTRITMGDVVERAEKIKTLTATLHNKIISLYIKFLEEWCIFDEFDMIESYIASIDVIKSGAKVAMQYKYCKPSVLDDAKSFLAVKNIRHPIVERICKQTYKPHSLMLGKKSDKNTELANGDSLLIYGLNSSGKSCLMKAVGLNVILAQSGMYVPCEKMIYSPYKNILTRILGNDNMYKGLSSFEVEMTELQGILARATEYSLVLGDEICHGTETKSAISLVASSIVYLMKRNASFIFATHLHQLMNIRVINELTTLGVYNILVTYDEVEQKLNYIRELQPGSGNSVYGIEAAKSKRVEPEVIDLANKIRLELMEEDEHIIRIKKSNYNSSLYMDKCVECGKNYSSETHHVKPQKLADSNGFIDHMHKNHISNLKPLCKSCHDVQHNTQI
jgi:DNA mismatch repair protein MutS